MTSFLKRLFCRKPAPTPAPKPAAPARPAQIPVPTKEFTPEVAAELAYLWDTLSITDPDRFDWYLAKLKSGQARYQAISQATNVPWWFIGLIHGMECGFDFRKHLHNGDPLTARTVLVPAGRPLDGKPPFTFEQSAVDALRMKDYDENRDWSIPRVLWMLERYNGFGYRLYRKMPSPYLWAGTNHYSKGKYVADGKWDANAVSKQAGVAGQLRLILG